MNKKLKITILIITLFLIATIIFLTLPQMKESKIKSAIEKANYCESDSDCVDAGGKCPFGCYVYVNKNEVGKISQLIESYDSKCVYGCITNPKVICENKKCKELFE
jgi:hypothetical protein